MSTNHKPHPKYKPQRKDTPIRDFGLIVRRFFSTTFGGRCPVCAEGRVTKNWFQNFDKCDRCGARFERGDWGNWLIAAVLNYFINAVVLIGTAILLVLRWGFFPGLTALLVGVAVVTALLIYRPVKSLAVWMVWVLGFIYPD